MKVTIAPASRFGGEIQVPGDKSLSHRALLFGALAKGTTEVSGLSGGEDVRSTKSCLEALATSFKSQGDKLVIQGAGMRGLRGTSAPLDCGNSGSTMRMMMGCLAGQAFSSRLVGDASLTKRPMDRVSVPLIQMGAKIALSQTRFAPVEITGSSPLRGIEYSLPVESAQVKSALLLAGLYAEGETRLTGKIHSRDHTERLLPYFGASLSISGEAIQIQGGQTLKGVSLSIPGDPSSAAFWMAGALVVKHGTVRLTQVLLNPTRIGFLRALQRMGAAITEEITSNEPEPAGNLEVSASRLKGISIRPNEVASLIDEIPMLAVLATFADGVTEIRGAEELRVKESDRIESVARNLKAMGVEIETFPDGLRLKGPQPLKGAAIDSFGDHRIAMAFAIGALGASGETQIDHCDSVAISYPEFFETLKKVTSA